MATSEGLPDGPPTKKAKIGGDANGEHYIFSFYLYQRTYKKGHKSSLNMRNAGAVTILSSVSVSVGFKKSHGFGFLSRFWS